MASRFELWDRFYKLFAEYLAHQKFTQLFGGEREGLRKANNMRVSVEPGFVKNVISSYVEYAADPKPLKDPEERFFFFSRLFQLLDVANVAWQTDGLDIRRQIKNSSAHFFAYYRSVMGLLDDASKKNSYDEKIRALISLFPTLTTLPGESEMARRSA